MGLNKTICLSLLSCKCSNNTDPYWICDLQTYSPILCVTFPFSGQCLLSTEVSNSDKIQLICFSFSHLCFWCLIKF